MTAAKWASSVAAVLAASFFTGYLLLVVLALEAPDVFDYVWPLPFLLMALVGWLVAARHPRNSIGWLLLATGFLMVGQGFFRAYAEAALRHAWDVPAVGLGAWLALWMWISATILIVVVMVLFPTGRPLSPRWRVFVWLALGMAALIPLAALGALPAPASVLLEAPRDVPGADLLVPLAEEGTALLIPGGVVAVVLRFRRAGEVVRLQLKWFVFSAALLGAAAIVMIVIGSLSEDADPIGNPVGAGALLLGMTALPVAIGVAILRYRLYEIDRIISRTVGYGLVVGLLASLYGLVVVGIPTVLPAVEDSQVLVAAATLAAFFLFDPLRKRILKAVDQRFYRSRYDAQQVVEAFASRLRDQIAVEDLTIDLMNVVEQAVQPSSLSVWVRNENAP